MSFWKKLFGFTASDATTAPRPGRTLEHQGFVIEARPYEAGGQYQVAGRITRVIDGVEHEHTFVRADRFGSADEAAEVALRKGRLIVDEQGRNLFT